MTSYGVSLLSGGLDSSTVTAHAKKCVDHLTALTFHYGQSHAKEIVSAEAIAKSLQIPHRTLDISFLGKVAWYSALTNPELFPMPTGRSGDEIGFGVPITYVPLRNTIFISLAAALLESDVLHAIENDRADPAGTEAFVYLAPNAVDYSGYPDCRPEFFSSATETINLGSKLASEHGIPIKIKTPIIEKSKAEIVRMSIDLNVPLEATWSCYRGGSRPCTECDSCLLRARGFSEAGVIDPTVV